MVLSRVALLASAASVLVAFQTVPAPGPSPVASTPLSGIFPASTRVESFTLTANGQRTYYADSVGDLWLYDHATQKSTRISSGPVWDVSVAPSAAAVAYTKAGVRRGDQFVFALTLDPATGLGRGAERRLSARPADSPSISPDGTLVAFGRDDESGVGQTLAVAPVGGGAERVVVPSLPSSLGNIRWTPDGKAVYFTVNPPVACVPEWSCLPLAQNLRQPPASIRRVAVSGGDVTTIATSRSGGPGLSPDGTTLLYLDTAQTRQWIVAAPDGTKRDTLALPASQTPIGWLTGSTVLVATGGTRRQVRTTSLSDAQPGTTIEGGESLADPSWSPDGTIMAALVRSSTMQLRLFNADGSTPRTLALPDNFATGSVWSPDGKWIAYLGYGAKPPGGIEAIEVSSGRVQRLSDLAADASSVLRWLRDSQRLVVSETFDRSETARHVAFRTIDLNGQSTALRDVPLGPPPSMGAAIDDSTAVVLLPGAPFRVVRLDRDDVVRDLVPGPSSDSASAMLSPDGGWLVVRRPAARGETAQGQMIELVRIDGSARSVVPLSFSPGFGRSLLMTPDASSLLVVEARRSDGADPGIYVVTLKNGTSRRLLSYSTQAGPPELAISPDGRRLFSMIWETVPPTVSAIDLSRVRAR